MISAQADFEVPGTPPPLRRALSAAILGLVTSMAACSGGLHSDAPATQVYVLRAAVHPQAQTDPPTASLHVSRPMAGPGWIPITSCWSNPTTE